LRTAKPITGVLPPPRPAVRTTFVLDDDDDVGDGEEVEEEKEQEEEGGESVSDRDEVYEHDYGDYDGLSAGEIAVRHLRSQNRDAATAIKETEDRLKDLKESGESCPKSDKCALQVHLSFAKKALLDTHRALKKLGEDSIAPEASSSKKAKSGGDNKYLYMTHALLPKEAENKPILIANAIKHIVEEKLLMNENDVGLQAELEVLHKVFLFFAIQSNHII
jgi:hypothetical protein